MPVAASMRIKRGEHISEKTFREYILQNAKSKTEHLDFERGIA